jgi:hypothetical protein
LQPLPGMMGEVNFLITCSNGKGAVR